ncbi:MAG: hypothetical protein JEZ14_22810 [Marinilabiliaceae bacterium]|nr:hypothetical protein [Marinilabiliaceae bacterium]
MSIVSEEKNTYLRLVLAEVENKFNRGKSNSWVNRDFHDLSFEVLQETDTRLSADTLKRIFGKLKTADGYYPQEATLMALIKYSGYQPKQPINEERQRGLNRKIASLIFIPVLVGILIGSVILFSQDNTLHAFQFEYVNKQGTAPFTASFHYDVSQLNDDTLWLNFGDNTGHPLPRNENLINHYYRYPGLFNTELYYGKKKIDSAEVYVGSEDWIVLANRWHDETRYYPVSLPVANKGGYLHATARDLVDMGMDTVGIIMTQYCNFKNFGIDGSNFRMRCVLKNAIYKPPVRCNGVHIEIQETSGKIFQTFNKPGCERWNYIQYGEKIMEGDHNDLSAFAYDLSEWSEVVITVQGKSAEITLNGNRLYQLTFNNPIGYINGLRFLYYGFGAVKSVELEDLRTCEMYQESFN